MYAFVDLRARHSCVVSLECERMFVWRRFVEPYVVVDVVCSLPLPDNYSCFQGCLSVMFLLFRRLCQIVLFGFHCEQSRCLLIMRAICLFKVQFAELFCSCCKNLFVSISCHDTCVCA